MNASHLVTPENRRYPPCPEPPAPPQNSRRFLRASLAAAVLLLASARALPAHAYDVAPDSQGNTLYLLLWHQDPALTLDNVTIASQAAGVVSSAATTFVPSSIPPGTARLAALEFSIGAGAAVGTAGVLPVTIGGTGGGSAIEPYTLEVPLLVSDSAEARQGIAGPGFAQPGVASPDTDGDGVLDVEEIAFGSDPLDPNSLPGAMMSSSPIPALSAMGIALFALILLGMGWRFKCRWPLRRRRGAS